MSLIAHDIRDLLWESLNPYYTGSTLWGNYYRTEYFKMFGLNPYYTGSTLWVPLNLLLPSRLTVLILIILEVLYEGWTVAD